MPSPEEIQGLLDSFPDNPGTETAAAPAAPATPAPPQDKDDALLASLETPAAAPAPTFDDEFLKKLDGIDPSTLKDRLPSKWRDQMLMQADYTRKTTEVAEERKALAAREAAFLNLVNAQMAEKGVNPSSDQQTTIEQKFAEGDYQGAAKLMQDMVSQRVAPYEAELAKRTAIERAESMSPSLRTPEVQQYVANALRNNPQIKELADRENFRYAPMVLTALAMEQELLTARARVAKFDDEKKAAQREAIEAYKRKVEGLPSSTTATSRPGSMRPEASKQYDDWNSPSPAGFEEAWEMAHRQR